MLKQVKLLQNIVHQTRLLPCLCGSQSTVYRQMHKGGKPRTTAPPKGKDNTAWEARIKALKGRKVVHTLTQKEIKEQEEFMKRVPKDDVWIQSEYPIHKFSFNDAIEMHREFCSSEMFDNNDGFVQFNATLNFRTKKKTKFVRGINNVLVLPHQFDDGNDARIMAVCKTEEEKSYAKQLGAVHAGGADVIKAIEKGEILYYEFDYLLCTTEMLPDLNKVRKLLKDSFPTIKKGTVGKDIKAMMEHFSLGKSYECDKIEDEAVGNVRVIIGKLNMSTTALKENLESYIEDFGTFKKAATGNFITDGSISVIPTSGETFYLHKEELMTSSEQELQQEIDQEIEQYDETESVVEKEDIDSDDENKKLTASRST